MILEHATLDVTPGQEAAFEVAFRRAKAIIAGAEGCSSVVLHRCVEHANRYLLLVEWDRLEDHTDGFRASPAYEEWRELLHHFYDPFPVVEHFEELERASSR